MATARLDLIVSGTGRCGTGYVSRILQEAGVAAGHEAYYTPSGERHVPGLRADVSWLAAPYLRSARQRGAAIACVYRHPAAVISSLMGIRFFDPAMRSEYQEFALAHLYPFRLGLPLVDGLPSKESEFEMCCLFYQRWNLLVLQDAHFTFNIDYPAWDRVAKVLPGMKLADLASAIPNVSQTYNHRQRSNIDLNAIPQYVWDVFQVLEDSARAS